jgi:hypothetical protein
LASALSVPGRSKFSDSWPVAALVSTMPATKMTSQATMTMALCLRTKREIEPVLMVGLSIRRRCRICRERRDTVGDSVIAPRCQDGRAG